MRVVLNKGRKSSPGPCVCGQPATVQVRVNWRSGARTYWYCAKHAADVLELDGVDRVGELDERDLLR